MSRSGLAGSAPAGFGGSLSPNLTIGIVSSIALAIPLALLCLGNPSTFLGPYRSGCRCARMAPMTMIIKKRAVMIPVMLYKIIIATAVVGVFPSMLPLSLLPPGVKAIVEFPILIVLFSCEYRSEELFLSFIV